MLPLLAGACKARRQQVAGDSSDLNAEQAQARDKGGTPPTAADAPFLRYGVLINQMRYKWVGSESLLTKAADCTGLLLTNRLVVTAAHCVEAWAKKVTEMTTRDVTVQFKGLGREPPRTVVYGLYPRQYPKQWFADLGILVLASPVGTAVPRVTIDFSDPVRNADVGLLLGRMDQNGQDSGNLRVHRQVRYEWQRWQQGGATSFDYLRLAEGHLTSCGDSGGPLFRFRGGEVGEATAVGVVTGKGDCTVNPKTVLSRFGYAPNKAFLSYVLKLDDKYRDQEVFLDSLREFCLPSTYVLRDLRWSDHAGTDLVLGPCGLVRPAPLPPESAVY